MTKRLISKDKDKEPDEPLYIKNAALEYNTKLFDTQKKAAEPPAKEVPKEEKKKEELPAKGTTKPAKQVTVTKTPATGASQAAKEEKPVESGKKKTAKSTKKKAEEPAKTVDEPEAGSEKKPGRKGPGIKIVGKLDLDTVSKKPVKKGKGKKQKAEEPVEELLTELIEAGMEEPVTETLPVTEEEPEVIEEIPKLEDNFLPREKINLVGPTILGTMKLPEPRKVVDKKKPVASSSDETVKGKKKKRKRIKKQMGTPLISETAAQPDHAKGKPHARKGGYRETVKPELSEEDIQKQIKETLARLGPVGKSKTSKYRRLKREAVSQQMQQEQEKIEEGKKVIQVTEFVTANELATMMNVPVTNIISTCMSLGLFVSINQRLDAETLTLVADEFGYQVEFVSVDVQEAISNLEETDAPEDLVPASAHSNGYGSCRSREDKITRLYPQIQYCCRRSRRDHTAYRRLRSATGERKIHHIPRYSRP